jgi:hypothetical protein
MAFTTIIGKDADGNIITTVTEIPELPPYIPTQQELILQQISTLEQQVTARRSREAVLGIDNGWLADINAQIATLRGQL